MEYNVEMIGYLGSGWKAEVLNL
uniref:Uncharacterized protein n=1 Tax=Rhizophora mucronata TaxID=61149 RepID=A0A2P2KF05_RHIMU